MCNYTVHTSKFKSLHIYRYIYIIIISTKASNYLFQRASVILHCTTATKENIVTNLFQLLKVSSLVISFYTYKKADLKEVLGTGGARSLKLSGVRGLRF